LLDGPRHPASGWAAFHVLEVMSAPQDVIDRAFVVIEAIAASDSLSAIGVRMRLKELRREFGKDPDQGYRAAAGRSGLEAADEEASLRHVRQQARDWRLLLQVSSVDAAGMDWGGGGCLFYWIREDALRARQFERSWAVLQTT
jgi:hypothetical protein